MYSYFLKYKHVRARLGSEQFPRSFRDEQLPRTGPELPDRIRYALFPVPSYEPPPPGSRVSGRPPWEVRVTVDMDA
jgi:hypothetical protein